MKKQERIAQILSYFRATQPAPKSELNYNDHYQLLVAVMLSAQCTDRRINQVTPALFEAFPSPAELARASVEEIFTYIRSVSYPNAKAEHLQRMAAQLVEKFHGEVPSTMEELTSLPGVGRKTANVIQAVAFGKATMAVDTHVFRVAHRLGFVTARATTPLAVEQSLMRQIPKEDIPDAHHWLLLHGRYVCTAQRPKCVSCGLKELCPFLRKYATCGR